MMKLCNKVQNVTKLSSNLYYSLSHIPGSLRVDETAEKTFMAPVYDFTGFLRKGRKH